MPADLPLSQLFRSSPQWRACAMPAYDTLMQPTLDALRACGGQAVNEEIAAQVIRGAGAAARSGRASAQGWAGPDRAGVSADVDAHVPAPGWPDRQPAPRLVGVDRSRLAGDEHQPERDRAHGAQPDWRRSAGRKDGQAPFAIDEVAGAYAQGARGSGRRRAAFADAAVPHLQQCAPFPAHPRRCAGRRLPGDGHAPSGTSAAIPRSR